MRRLDWVAQLWRVVNEARGREFKYGDHDCCLFAARAIDAQTGGDFEKRLLKKYSDESSATRYIQESGGIERAISTFLGVADEALPRRGDICMVGVEGGQRGVGVCLGATIAVAADAGLEFYPLGKSMKAWRI